MNPPVFRKIALERLSSPEQLDQLTQVTTPRGWIALSAFYLLLVTGVVWSFAGRLPEKVTGNGILVKTGGVLTVVPGAGGRVVDMAVTVGDTVSEGQVVARLEQPELSNELLQSQSALTELRARHRQLVSSGTQDLGLQSRYVDQQRVMTQQSIEATERAARGLAEKIDAQEKLVRQGLLTRSTLLSSRQQYDNLEQTLSSHRSELTKLAARALELRDGQDRDSSASAFKVREQEQRVAQLERDFQERSVVRSPYTGRILELMVETGDVIGRGEPIMSLDLSGRAVQDLEAVIFVPPVDGKRIKPGMTIQIAPSTVKQEEFGLMLGRVTYVSDFPATPKGMLRVLKNDQLVSGLAQGRAPYEVRADLLVDPATVSRYKWSSSGGPPIRIQSGTLALGNIEVASRRPIEMVMPILRRALGL
ncbi:MAG: NHLP bacteriocin system secretion protein [Gemmatimonadaceae bacterium]|nr:NHLP bacteriocin system secretion protein [Gemmatimonadaceae bacterium]